MNGRRDDQILYLPSPNPEQDLRLHLDENISRSVAQLLRNRGFDVTTTNDVGLRAKSDTLHMTYALEQQRIIVTRDRDFLQLHDQEHAHSGIVYWPHTESLSRRTMQELLVRILQQVAAAPTNPAELPTAACVVPSKKKKRKSKRKRQGAKQAPPVSNKLPPGIHVRAVVTKTSDTVTELRLASGQTGWILAEHHAVTTPTPGQELEAVTVSYVKARKRLYLSLRRGYCMARTMPTAGLRQLRRTDHQLVRAIQGQWPVEIAFEEAHVVRVYGVTSESVREVISHLHRLIPWSASALIQVDRLAFKAWVKATYGSLGKMGQATSAWLNFHHDNRLCICAETNRGLDSILTLIQQHNPDMQVCGLQAARSEPLTRCQWPSLND
jgi:predicted nuclease of predicted toxin-antitoxin system